ncbi:aldo/keto reductase [Thermoactinospora rubra]|uniref:aldo/keto reductase n=1 Tax=Thermoactinospora rubra TaxID=1088767 RepID=UPI000A12083B|nr:aldo/keto reductase [Thermoactinospora rubra]
MDARTLGRHGLVSSAIGLGTAAFTGAYGPADARESVRVIRHALDLGVTMLDATARFPGSFPGSEVERLVGRAIAGRRDRVVLAALARADGRRQGLAGACDAALRRFGVDHIDVYYLDCATWRRPVEEGVGELAALVAAGKVRHIGLSEPSAEQIRRAAAEQPVSVIACEYSLWRRQAELDRLPAAREHRIGVVACRPLGRGFLAGTIRSAAQLAEGDVRHGDPRFEPYAIERGLRALRPAEETAARLHLGLGRLALAWLLARGGDVVPIPSTRSRVHLEMNVSAAAVDADLAGLDGLFPWD